ncbi:MAG: extracellular solute-binding protein [Deltaproteobacteria bacterium]|nr:extracellular solute-binding protein [Deltaproteobacteria bacterium]
MKNRGPSIGFLSAFLTLTIGSQAPSALSAPANSLPELIEAAKSEGQLNLVAQANVWGGVEGARMLERVFNQTYKVGAKIRFAPGPNMPTMAGRLLTEAKAKQVASTDLYVGAEAHAPLIAGGGVVDPFPWTKVFPYITQQMVELDNRVVLATTRFPGVSYNAKLVSKDDVPRRMDDLLDPKWKGKIASTPIAVSFDRVADVLGYAKIKEFLQKFSRQIGGLIQCGEMERLASGQFLLLAFDCGDYVAEQAKARGLPVESEILEDAAHTGHFYLAVPKNSPHPNLATLFSGFLLSREGQQAFWEIQKSASHLVEGTPAQKRKKAIEERNIKLHGFTATYVAAREERLLKWRNEFMAILQKK